MNPDNQQIDARVNPEFVQPDLREVEEEYWHLITERDSHVQVQQGSIDTGSGSDGYGFPTSRSSSCGRHPWNLKILSNNSRSLLRTMGPLMGVTIPTLNVGMLFTTACWYRDPHGLPWIEYHHTGKTPFFKDVLTLNVKQNIYKPFRYADMCIFLNVFI